MADQGEKNENRAERSASGSQVETVVRPPVFPVAEFARSLFKRHDMTTTVTPLSQKILSRYKTSQGATRGKSTDLPLVQAKPSLGFEHADGVVEIQNVRPASAKPAVQARLAESGIPTVQGKKTEENRGKCLVSRAEQPIVQKIGIGIIGNQLRSLIPPVFSKKNTNKSLKHGDGRIQGESSVQGVMGEGMERPSTLRQVAQNESSVSPIGSGQGNQTGRQSAAINHEIIQRKVIETNPSGMVTRRGKTGIDSFSTEHMEVLTSEILSSSESRKSPMTGKMPDRIVPQRMEQGQTIRATAEPAEQKVDGKGSEPVPVVRSSVQRASVNQVDDRTAMVFRKETGGKVNEEGPASSFSAVIKPAAQGDGRSIQSKSRSSVVKAAFPSSVAQAKPMGNSTNRLPLVQTKIMGMMDNDQGISSDRQPLTLGSGLIQKQQHRPSMVRRTQDTFLPGAEHGRQILIRPFLPLTGVHGDQRVGKTTDPVQRKQNGSTWEPGQTESKSGEFSVFGNLPVVTADYALDSPVRVGNGQTVQRSSDNSGGFGQAMDMPMPLGLTQSRVVEKVVQRVENNLGRSDGAPSSSVSSVQTPAMPSSANIPAPATTPETMQGPGEIQALVDQVYVLIMERLSVERESLGL